MAEELFKKGYYQINKNTDTVVFWMWASMSGCGGAAYAPNGTPTFEDLGGLETDICTVTPLQGKYWYHVDILDTLVVESATK